MKLPKRILSLYQARKIKLREIAAQFNINTSTAHRELMRMGYVPRQASGKRPDKAKHRKVLALAARGMSLREIGSEVGWTREGVRQVLAANGRPTRPRAYRCRRCGERLPVNAICVACLRADDPIGVRIRAYRLAAGLRQEDLAARIGASKSTVGAWEYGVQRPSETLLEKLPSVLGVSEKQLGHPPG